MITGTSGSDPTNDDTHADASPTNSSSTVPSYRLSVNHNSLTFSGTDSGLATMTETVGFDIKRFKFHLNLYNKYSALENLSEEGNVDSDIMNRAVTKINMLNHYISEQETSEFTIQMFPYMQLPKPYKVHASEVDYKNGAQKYRKQLEHAKNTIDIERQVMETEALLSKVDTTSTRSLEHLNELHNTYIEHKHIIRNFHYLPSRLKQKRAYELQKRKYTDRLCSDERRYATSSRKVKHIMFVGDRGLGIGSRIKGYMRYGGHWKPLKHSLYTSVCITSEHNTSQTCIYCFQKPSHPLQTVYKNGARRLRTINGTFICDNPSCVSVQAKKAVKGRDTLSAMVIGLSGLATFLFYATFPQFDPQVSQSNTNKFKTNAAFFFTANEDWPAVDDSNTF
ncbi:hypothetical protein CU097_004618 [Rhizopus azygosporus]|uniref:Uncharacterized protein n=1 Tax=Rhizopus azygosporus TaxID=86630 RepID=A0A367JDV2_RHIAZ|nr:hypothetical protein CU097_004618 [Rhizopus azygosporus]